MPTRFWLRALTIAGLCASSCGTKPFDSTDGSGGECDNTPGTACTWANSPGVPGYGSYSANVKGDGEPIDESWLYFPADLTFGPDGNAYVVDFNNHRIRPVTEKGTFYTLAGTSYEGDGPPDNADRLPVGHPAGCAPAICSLNHPTDVKFAPNGSLVIAAWHDNKIRVVTPSNGSFDPINSKLVTLAGIDYGFSGDGGPAYAAYLNRPKSLSIDPEGRIYFIDQVNVRIRMIDIDAQRTINTIAGNGTKGYAGDGTRSRSRRSSAGTTTRTRRCRRERSSLSVARSTSPTAATTASAPSTSTLRR